MRVVLGWPVLLLVAWSVALPVRAGEWEQPVVWLPDTERVPVMATEVWGQSWVSGAYLARDLQLGERVGVNFGWQAEHGYTAVSLSYRTGFTLPAAGFSGAQEEPLTLRLTLRGWELFESNSEQGADLLSFDRIRDREIRRQLWMISLSKRF